MGDKTLLIIIAPVEKPATPVRFKLGDFGPLDSPYASVIRLGEPSELLFRTNQTPSRAAQAAETEILKLSLPVSSKTRNMFAKLAKQFDIHVEEVHAGAASNYVFLIDPRKGGLFNTRQTVSTDLVRLKASLERYLRERLEVQNELTNQSARALLEAGSGTNPIDVTLRYLFNLYGIEGGSIWALHNDAELLSPILTLEASSLPLSDYRQTCLRKDQGLAWRVLGAGKPKVEELSAIKATDLQNSHLFPHFRDRYLYLVRLENPKGPYAVACLASSTRLALNCNDPIFKTFEQFVWLEYLSKAREGTERLMWNLRDLGGLEEASITDLCKQMAGKLRRLLNAEAASILLKPKLDDTSRELILQAADISSDCSPSASLLAFRGGQEIRYVINESSLSGSVAYWNKPIIENEVSKCKQNSHKFKEVSPTGNDTWIGVPLQSPDGKCIGVIRCGGKRSMTGGRPVAHFFREADLVLLRHASIIFAPLLKLAKASQDAKDSAAQLEEAEHLREHEMRGPLQAIIASAEFVKDRLSDLGATSKERKLEHIIANTDLCSALLTSPSVPVREEFAKTLKHVNLKALLLNLVGVFRHQIEDRSPNEIYFDETVREFRARVQPFMVVELRGHCPPIIGSADFLQRAFYNLGNNALKYADRSKPGRLIIACKENPHRDEVILTFEDFGLGVLESEKERIFQRSERGSASTNIQGKGLGLTVAKDVVEAHGGSLILERLKDPTVFEVRLPTKPTL